LLARRRTDERLVSRRAIVGTVLFGTLHVLPGPDPVASAFSHSSQLALLANVGILALALILVMALPRKIPVRKP
jgi:hypothetical protein